MKENIYCEGCVNLSLTEEQQNRLPNGKNLYHECRKYGVAVKHLGHHPNILRCSKCIDSNSKEAL